MIVLFAGSIGRFPVGGHAWVDMQWLVGLRELGCEVYYLEECGPESWVYHWEAEELTTELEYPTDYLRSSLEAIGMEKRFSYRAGDTCVGMGLEEIREICRRADLFLIRGVSLDVWRDEYDWPRTRIFVDSDPGFTQIRAMREPRLAETIGRCSELFTVGQAVGTAASRVPTLDRKWWPIPPPVALSHWKVSAAPDDAPFTSVLQWKSYKDVEYEGRSYGNKEREFPKFRDLPLRTDQRFRMALTGAPPEFLSDHGWEVVSGWETSFTPELYQAFIAGSRAEFGVAKHGYVESRGGWISDRTACYLAMGRPALVQATGVPASILPSAGFLTFEDADGALDGVAAINADYEMHCRAAREFAETYFDATRVAHRVLDVCLNRTPLDRSKEELLPS